MKSFLGILTYRRLHALQTMLHGIQTHCPQYKCVVAEDCGQRDATASFLNLGRLGEPRPDLAGVMYTLDHANPDSAYYPWVDALLGDRNLGVASNSNRLIKLFMDSDCDHLCLCNDDLLVKGDFVKFYGQAHQDLDVGMFCFCDFTHHPSYKWTTHQWRGYGIKFMPRFTGIMISITRQLVEKIGYFDAEFGAFGEEHCDYTIRARLGGGIKCDGADMNCLDLEHNLLQHQDVETSVVGAARQNADKEAGRVMQRAAFEYKFRHYYRPFRLQYPAHAGGYFGTGMAARQLEQVGYKIAPVIV